MGQTSTDLFSNHIGDEGAACADFSLAGTVDVAVRFRRPWDSPPPVSRASPLTCECSTRGASWAHKRGGF